MVARLGEGAAKRRIRQGADWGVIIGGLRRDLPIKQLSRKPQTSDVTPPSAIPEGSRSPGSTLPAWHTS
jgi:hypothetical protein